MQEKCPVCKSNIKATDKACSVCGFADLHREFITIEDAELWLRDVVGPYRSEWNSNKSKEIRNEPKEIRNLIKRANLGDAIAQNNLGTRYSDGNGVKQDYEKAMYWYRKSAEQGQKTAQNNLGTCYQFGKGVAKDINMAIYYYEQAIKNGSNVAAHNLAMVYDKTTTEYPNDYEKAFKYYKLAEERGYSAGNLFNNIGRLYMDGQGVSKNYELAEKYFKKATSLGDSTAQENLRILKRSNNSVYASNHTNEAANQQFNTNNSSEEDHETAQILTKIGLGILFIGTFVSFLATQSLMATLIVGGIGAALIASNANNT